MPEATRNLGRQPDCGQARRVLGRPLGSCFLPTRCLRSRAGASTDVALPPPAQGGPRRLGGPAARGSGRPDSRPGKGEQRGTGRRTPTELDGGPRLCPLAKFTAAWVQPRPAPRRADLLRGPPHAMGAGARAGAAPRSRGHGRSRNGAQSHHTSWESRLLRTENPEPTRRGLWLGGQGSGWGALCREPEPSRCLQSEVKSLSCPLPVHPPALTPSPGKPSFSQREWPRSRRRRGSPSLRGAETSTEVTGRSGGHSGRSRRPLLLVTVTRPGAVARVLGGGGDAPRLSREQRTPQHPHCCVALWAKRW